MCHLISKYRLINCITFKIFTPMVLKGHRGDRYAVSVVADEISRSGVSADGFDQLGGAGTINKLTQVGGGAFHS